MANIKSSSMATAAFRGKTEASKTEVKASDTKHSAEKRKVIEGEEEVGEASPFLASTPAS